MRNCNAIPGRTMQNVLLGMSLDAKSQHRPHPLLTARSVLGGCSRAVRSQISLCISESPSAGGARFLCVSRRAPRRGVHPKMDHPKVYLTEVHLWMGVRSIGMTNPRQRFRHGSRPNRGNSCPATIFDYETLLTPSFGKNCAIVHFLKNPQ